MCTFNRSIDLQKKSLSSSFFCKTFWAFVCIYYAYKKTCLSKSNISLVAPPKKSPFFLKISRDRQNQNDPSCYDWKRNKKIVRIVTIFAYFDWIQPNSEGIRRVKKLLTAKFRELNEFWCWNVNKAADDKSFCLATSVF